MPSANEKVRNQMPTWVTHVVLQDGNIVFMASSKRTARSAARALTKRGNPAVVHDWPIPDFQI